MVAVQLATCPRKQLVKVQPTVPKNELNHGLYSIYPRTKMPLSFLWFTENAIYPVYIIKMEYLALFFLGGKRNISSMCIRTFSKSGAQ
jgi:hypothetical protein